jgi:tetratricopeptide (TPR) repeat protein
VASNSLPTGGASAGFTAVPPLPSDAPAQAATFADDRALRGYRDILERDPKNFQAAVNAGNLLYDARRYQEAVPFYLRAHALNPTDVNVSTDLGTALWYSGKPDEALAQYARSLAVDPDHAQTLFNGGIVKAEGKGDYRGAVAGWQRLLDRNRSYSGASIVRNMIDAAQGRAGAAN